MTTAPPSAPQHAQETVPAPATKPIEAPSFVAEATDVTEGKAYETARRRLLVALLNDESMLANDPYADAFAMALHKRKTNSWTKTSHPNGITAQIELNSDDALLALSRFATILPEVALPQVSAPLRATVRGYRESQLQRKLCTRQKELSPKAECELVDPINAQQELLSALEHLQLMSTFEGGIPTADGAFLRPVVAVAKLQINGIDRPLPDLTIQVQSSNSKEPLLLQTDEKGVLSYQTPPGTPLNTTFTLATDIPALVGTKFVTPHQAPLLIRSRPIGIARCALLSLGSGQPESTSLLVVEQTLGTDRHQRIELPAADEELLRSTSPPDWKLHLPRLADRYAGRLDTVLLLQAESEFASRMGTHRVWFEARGKLTAFNAWTGEVLVQVDASVTESGVGEQRAAQAAQKALGRVLASKLETALANSPKRASQATTKTIAAKN